MTKLTIPPMNYKTEMAPGKLADAVKSLALAKVGELVRAPIDVIKVLDGFNVRVRETEDYKTGIASLQSSIAENGFYSDKPLSGYVAKEGESTVLYLRDGHRRLEAVQAHNFEAPADAKIESLPVVIVPANTTMEEHLVNLVQSNSGKDLTPFEKGLVVKRLVNFGQSKADIAKKLGFTPRYIDDLLVIVSAPAAARTLILENKVSSTQALRELRKDPEKAAAALQAMVKSATDKGKAKGTAKDKGPKMQKAVVVVNFGAGDIMGDVLKAMASQIRSSVGHDAESDAISTDGSLSVTISTPAPVVEKPAPAAKPAKPVKEPKPAAEKKPPRQTKAQAAAKTAAAAKAEGLLPETKPDAEDPLAHALGGGEPADISDL